MFSSRSAERDGDGGSDEQAWPRLAQGLRRMWQLPPTARALVAAFAQQREERDTLLVSTACVPTQCVHSLTHSIPFSPTGAASDAPA